VAFSFAITPKYSSLPPSWLPPLDPKEIVTLEELTLSNMWEVAALIEGHL